jgi:sugar phosphate isomerase/epimerase
MKLSLSGRMFEVDYQYCELSMEGFATTARDIGYQGVELRKTQVSLDTPAQEVARIARIIKKAGLEVTCVTTRGVSLKDQESFGRFKNYVSLAEALGCKLIKAGGDVPWLQRAADYAAEHGITTAGNTHIQTPFETVSSSMERLRAIGRKNYRLIYDPANLFMAQEDYGAETVEKLADSICYVTVQCPQSVPLKQEEGLFKYKGFAYKQGLPGEERTPDFDSVFRGLDRIGYEGWVSVVEPRREGMTGTQLARSFYQACIGLIP